MKFNRYCEIKETPQPEDIDPINELAGLMLDFMIRYGKGITLSQLEFKFRQERTGSGHSGEFVDKPSGYFNENEFHKAFQKLIKDRQIEKRYFHSIPFFTVVNR